jgi:hypothetical protein
VSDELKPIVVNVASVPPLGLEINNTWFEPSVPRLTHALHVQVLRLPALAGVLLKKALALARVRNDLVKLYPTTDVPVA